MDVKEMQHFIKAYVKALNSQDIELIESFHAEHSLSKSGGQPGTGMGRIERQQYFRQRQRAFPDFQMIVSRIDVDTRNGRATFDWEVTSTHRGHFKGIPPTNRKVTHQGTTELLIKNDKIVSETSYQDLAAFMNQLQMEEAIS